MNAVTIPEDLASVLAAWNAGEPVRSIALGHTQRMHTEKSGPTSGTQRVDMDRPAFRNRQDLAHAWAFRIVEHFAGNGGLPQSHEEFVAHLCEARVGLLDDAELTEEEQVGAESLAWKALLVGWAVAIDGLPPTAYVTVRKNGSGAAQVAGKASLGKVDEKS